jgi:transcriptional regulator with XRE-family HTH domain
MVKARVSKHLNSCLVGNMLNEALRLIRIFHDITQRDLAARLKIVPSYLCEIEAGKKEPTMPLLRKYSEEFKIPMSSILFFAEHMGDGQAIDRLRAAVSGKVLALLKFIAARSRRDAEQ